MAELAEDAAISTASSVLGIAADAVGDADTAAAAAAGVEGETGAATWGSALTSTGALVGALAGVFMIGAGGPTGDTEAGEASAIAAAGVAGTALGSKRAISAPAAADGPCVGAGVDAMVAAFWAN